MVRATVSVSSLGLTRASVSPTCRPLRVASSSLMRQTGSATASSNTSPSVTWQVPATKAVMALWLEYPTRVKSPCAPIPSRGERPPLPLSGRFGGCWACALPPLSDELEVSTASRPSPAFREVVSV